MRKSIFIFLFISFSTTYLIGQSSIDPKNFDYSKADSIALNFPKGKYKSSAEIVRPLIAELHTEHERLRVLYRWVTDNITYSYGNRSSDPAKVLKKGKAVCIGYATLLNEILTSAGLTSKIISGYSKTRADDIGKKFDKPDHAWNAVKLNGTWYLIDATWAAGSYDTKKRKFVKEHKELYFLTPPDIFIKKHLPIEKEWQLLSNAIKKNEFSKEPLYYSSWFDGSLKRLSPQKGTLRIKMKDTLELKVESNQLLQNVYLQLNNSNIFYSPEIEISEGCYLIKQKFERPGNYNLNLYVDNVAVAAFKLQIKD